MKKAEHDTINFSEDLKVIKTKASLVQIKTTKDYNDTCENSICDFKRRKTSTLKSSLSLATIFKSISNRHFTAFYVMLLFEKL